MRSPLGWIGIVRLGLVQAAIGAVVVLTTSTLNRVMVVELRLPAILPGALVALHYGLQVLRPRFGYGSDVGQRRTPYIIGGMAALASGGVLAAASTALMAGGSVAPIALAVPAFALVGVGVGACGTSLLTLLAERTDPGRRGAAATVVWIMMIAGIALTAGVAGRLLEPFSPGRLVLVAGAVAVLALAVTIAAVAGVEGAGSGTPLKAPAAAAPFLPVLRQVWAEPASRRFAIFVFVSMFAYSAQELVMEPFLGSVFAMAPGASTGLNGLQHGGVLAGMLLVAIAGSARAGGAGSMRVWAVGGCLCSAMAALAIGALGFAGPSSLIRPALFLLGAANGSFAVSAIGAMMGLAGEGRAGRDGTRIGLWGAAQALAFGAGGIAGPGASDIARALLGKPDIAYAAVFAAEAALFLFAASLAARVIGHAAARPSFLSSGSVNPTPSHGG